MGKVRFGCKKIELGVFDTTDGSSDTFVAIPVYRETFTMTEPEPAVQEHYEQGKSAPRVRRVTPASTQITFQLMDTDPDALAAALGGTVSTVESVKTWNEPKDKDEKIKSLRITVEDDSVILIPAFSHYARINLTITEANIHLIDVSGVITDTGFDAVPNMKWTDPPAA